MTHDEKCDNAHLIGEVCSCADRAIAAARRQGRIEGVQLAAQSWKWTGWYGSPVVVAGEDPIDRARGVAEWREDKAISMVDERWPEDKP